MSKRQHQPISINRLFHQKQFSQIEQPLQRRLQLQQLGSDILAHYKLQQCRIVNMRQGVAIIEAPSSAWLTRLKQFRFELLSDLRKAIPGVVSLELKINPELKHIKPEPEVKSTGKRQLSAEAARHITELSKHVPDELKEKLKKLAALSGES
ncbi:MULTISPECIES: DUF721 domain-containing protein [unclassified Agarivorans]|uniref:DUF721 domain-containing protein n=1 Tax=unclassified Agarivorans TaxID=2636026 RepID=UPI003D7D908D